MKHPVQWYDFTTWVEQQDDDAIVGTSYSTSDCPVSNYVKERHPDLSPVYTTPLATYHIPDGDRAGQRRWLNPPWLATIILRVDAVGLDVPISGRQLKQCLATAPFSQPSPDQSGNNTWGQLTEDDEGEDR